MKKILSVIFNKNTALIKSMVFDSWRLNTHNKETITRVLHLVYRDVSFLIGFIPVFQGSQTLFWGTIKI